MKGISFQNGVEFKVMIEGETWSQGDSLSGSLHAVSRNSNANLPPLKLIIAEGIDKKIKLKNAEAFTVLETLSTEVSELQWKFTLPKTVRITDTKGSLYLLYGSSEDLNALAQLKLTVLPHPHIREFCESMNIHARFITKNITAGKKGIVEVKLAPPDAKEWTFLEQLIISFSIHDQVLNAHFEFTRKEVDAMKGGLHTKTTIREIEREFQLSHLIHDFNQRLNKEVAAQAIDSVLAEYKSAGWLAS